MKLIRFGKYKHEKPGILLADGKRKDLSGYFTDWNCDFFCDKGLEKLQEIVKQNSARLPDVPNGVRLGSCVARPGKVVCIGLNYSDHAAEAGMTIPAEPIVFMKGTNTVVGPNDSILIPRGSTKTDWEAELGVVIGKDTRYLKSLEEAEECIAGYCISNDLSERAFQMERGGQWTKGKSCDNFNPIGPWLVTKDEIHNVHALSIELKVNNITRQKGNTKFMIFSVNYIVQYLSQFMTLEAGDIISTGTPPGVGMGLKPPQFLKAGDVVEISIEQLGTQHQICENA